jgi:NAD(P)-dependent dehydrogenase (short-subunit alcohol dehydrogenase family)
MRLKDKRVLITGTGGGQGDAAQRLFAQEGARVVGCDVKPGAAELTAQALRDEGHDVEGVTVDLAEFDAASSWIENAARRLGGIDVLYNNAAGFAFAPFAEMSLETWRHSMRTELDIVFHTTRPAWRYLCDGGGSVINTASVSATRGIAPLGQAAHAAAKGGVLGLTATLAAEGAEHGVRVNAISPGLVASPAAQVAGDDPSRSHLWSYMVGLHLLGRAGTGDDTAYLALYLASDESSWVTGQNYVIDGGWTAGFR